MTNDTLYDLELPLKINSFILSLKLLNITLVTMVENKLSIFSECVIYCTRKYVTINGAIYVASESTILYLSLIHISEPTRPY